MRKYKYSRKNYRRLKNKGYSVYSGSAYRNGKLKRRFLTAVKNK